MCVLETDSEIGVEKISLANDSVTKSLDLICFTRDYSAYVVISCAM